MTVNAFKPDIGSLDTSAIVDDAKLSPRVEDYFIEIELLCEKTSEYLQVYFTLKEMIDLS